MDDAPRGAADTSIDVFFSCSSENVKGLEPFLLQLMEQIRQRSPDLSGYYYRRPQNVGSIWAEKAGEALRQAKVFVPVYSPHFFNSETCDREYAAFLRRLQINGSTTERVVPIWWLKSRSPISEAIRGIVDSRALLPVEHSDKDLETLFATRQDAGSPYEVLLRDLADLIIRRAGGAALRPGPAVDLRNGRTIFGLPSMARPASLAADRVKRAYLVCVAGTALEMEEVFERSDRRYYGSKRGDWNPFADHADQEIVDVAIDVTRELGLRPIEEDVDAELVPYVEKREIDCELVMLFVDPWAIRVAKLAYELNDYDRRRFANSAVFIPVPHGDRETIANLSTLTSATLPLVASDGVTELFRNDIGSMEELRSAIKAAVHKLRRRALMRASKSLAARWDPVRLPPVQGPVV